MARRRVENRNVRSLFKTSGGRSYGITLPIEVIRRWRWKNRQKLTVKINEKKRQIIIEDWKR